MLFSNLSLAQPILHALTQEGYTTPTPIQQKAIPPALAGRDVLGCAQTGTGKTAAFALPILHRLVTGPVDKARRGPVRARALVLSPTRELAVQIGESFGAYGRDCGLSHTCIFGGVSQFRQERALSRGVDIIVATPGRLIDLIEQRLVDLGGVETLVLDEADRMLDMGFIQPIRRIAALTPASRQTLLFSATMPREIVRLAESLLRDPVRVAVDPVASAAPKIEQSVYMVGRKSKQPLLEKLLLDNAKITRALVFTRTKHGADKVGRRLARAGIRSETIHGNKAQNQRTRALERFRSGQARVLVATDVAARGLDVDHISHVFNFDLPVEAEAYVHRIGRTGRAGATGIAVAFCDGEERELLRDIERLMGKRVPVMPTPALPQAAEVSGDWALENLERPSHPSNRGQHRPYTPPQGGHRHPRAGAPNHGHHASSHGGSSHRGAHSARRARGWNGVGRRPSPPSRPSP